MTCSYHYFVDNAASAFPASAGSNVLYFSLQLLGRGSSDKDHITFFTFKLVRGEISAILLNAFHSIFTLYVIISNYITMIKAARFFID